MDVSRAIKLSRATMKKIKQNLFWAFAYNSGSIPSAAIGLLSPILAAAAMALSSISVIANSSLLKRYKITRDEENLLTESKKDKGVKQKKVLEVTHNYGGEIDVAEKFLINNLLLGVTGSVGVLAVPDYIKLLRESFAERVYVMMSHSAKKFVTPYTLRLYSGNYVFSDSFDISDDVRVPHIELTRKCDMFVIMPATANIIGKVANGICDDLISTAVMAFFVPGGFFSSMHFY